MATITLVLIAGLARQRLVEPSSVPDELLGEAMVLLYRRVRASA
jgi:hypothetical protein